MNQTPTTYKLIVALATLALSPSLYAGTRYWKGEDNNNWRRSGNWSNGSSPSSTDVAGFLQDVSVNSVDLSDSSGDDKDREVLVAYFYTKTSNNTTEPGFEVDWHFKNGRLITPKLIWKHQDEASDVRLFVDLLVDGTTNFQPLSPATSILKMYGNIEGSGVLNLSNSSTVELHSANTFGGTFQINSGELRIREANALTNATVDIGSAGAMNYAGTNANLGLLIGNGDTFIGYVVTVTVGTNNASGTYSGIINGSGNLIKAGTGTWTVSGAHTRTGDTTITNGTIHSSNATSFENSHINTHPGGTFYTGSSQAIGSLSGSGTLEIPTGNALEIKGVADTSRTFSGTINGSGALTNSAGILNLNGSLGDFSGDVFLTGGQARPGATRLENSLVTVSADDTLDLTTDITLGQLAGTGDVSLDFNLTFGGLNSDATYSGDLASNGTITKNGTGTWNFNGTKSGTGVVSISAGKLGGVGSITGNTMIASSAFLSPGNSVGTITFSNDLDLNGDYEVEIDGASNDLSEVAGTLDITGADLALTATDSGFTENVYIIASYGSLTGTFTTISGMPAGYSIDYTYNDGSTSNNIALIKDLISPILDSITLGSAHSSPTNADSISFDILFNENVEGVDASDFTVVFTGGSGTPTLTGSGSSYTLTVPSITGDGNLSVSLPDGSGITDDFSNPIASNSITTSVTVDNTVPLVSISTDESLTTSADSVAYSITFSEVVVGFDSHADFYFTGNTAATTDIEATTIVDTGNGKDYTLTLNNISGDGNLHFRLYGYNTKDLAGNNLAFSSTNPHDPFGPALTIDNTAPTVTSITPSTVGPVDALQLDFTVVFDEDVANFDSANDLVVGKTGSANYNHISVIGSGSTFTVSITGISGTGTLNLAVNTGSDVEDVFGNALTASLTSVDVNIARTTPARILVNASNPTPVAPYTTWATAATSLQDALLYTASGDQIWVAAGVYYPDEGLEQADNDSEASFVLQSNVSIYGGFSGGETALAQSDPDTNLSILSGDITENDVNTDGNFIAETSADQVDPSGHATVVRASGVTGVTLDGLVITAGRQQSDMDAGGVNVRLGSEVSVNDCLFSGNLGGLAFVEGANGQLSNSLLTGSDIAGVTSACYINDATAVISDCSFTHNTSDHGALRVSSNRAVTLTRCIFAENTSSNEGGAVNFINSIGTVQDCTFIGNSCGQLGTQNSGGAIFSSDSNTDFTNCAFSGNLSRGYAGAISFVDQDTSTLTNCSFSGNRSETGTGGVIITANGAVIDVNNCILWNNQDSTGTDTTSASLIDLTGNSTITTRNSIIANSGGSAAWNTALGTDGGGNLDTNPLFVTATDPATAPNDTGDLRLLSYSPAVEYGDNSLLPAGITTDLLGNARIQDTTIDMGAYEGEITLYSLWSDINGLTSGNENSDDNPDGDTYINLLEFAFGLDPLTNNSTLELDGLSMLARGGPTIYRENTPFGVDYHAIFIRRADFTSAGLTYTVQFSSNLKDWEDISTIPTVLETDINIELVSVTFPALLNSGKKARFSRIKVDITP